MNCREFHDTAIRLVAAPTEGDWRSAVSRSYYFIFHRFRELLLANGLDVGQGGQSHYTLYVGLFNCGIQSVATIADRIDDLRRMRIWADYELAKSMPQALAQAMVQEAQSLASDFQAVSKAISIAQVVHGARQYLQSVGRIAKSP